MLTLKNKSLYNLELIILAITTGIIRKIYDEIVDEKKTYNASPNLIQIISYLFLILAGLLLYFDLSFLLLLIIFVISNYIHLLIHKLLGYKYEDAFNTLIMKLVVVYVIILIAIKYPQLKKYFSNIYNIIVFVMMFGIVFVEMGIQFPSRESKLVLRILFCIFVVFFIWRNPQYLIAGLYLLGYMITSILSIIYMSLIKAKD